MSTETVEMQTSQSSSEPIDYASLSYTETSTSNNGGQAATQPDKNIKGLSPEEMLSFLEKGENVTDSELEIPEDDNAESMMTEDAPDQEEDTFEIVWKGQVERLSKEQVKQLAQMGKDYTQKTQALSEERKAWETERKHTEAQLNEYVQKLEQKEQSLSTKMESYEKFDMAIDVLKEQDPDFYADLQARVNAITRQVDNPVIRRQLDTYNSKISKLEQELEKASLSKIKEGFYNEVNQAKQTLGSKLEKLGIFVDWDGAVKQQYVNGAKDVQTAVYAIYGDQIQKAYDSKLKLNDVKQKVGQGKATPSAVTASKGSKIDYSKMDYQALANAIQMGKLPV